MSLALSPARRQSYAAARPRLAQKKWARAVVVALPFVLHGGAFVVATWFAAKPETSGLGFATAFAVMAVSGRGVVLLVDRHERARARRRRARS